MTEENEQENYFYRFCCNVPSWVTSGISSGGGEGEETETLEDFKTICPCPFISLIYKSTSQVKDISGIAHNNRFYGLAVTTGYTAQIKSNSIRDAVSGNIQDSFVKTQTATCDGIEASYQGSFKITGEDKECNEVYDSGFYHVDEIIAQGQEGSWNGGTEFTVGTFDPSGTNFGDAAVEVKMWSYADSCNPDDEDMILHGYSNVTVEVNDSALSTEYSECATYCEDSDATEGNRSISFIPCGASTLGISNTGTETNVKYATLFKSLRVDETYKAYLRLQYRDYLANYGVDEAPEPEANWVEDEPVEISEFTADKTYKLIGGTLNVPVADFEAQNLSTSIYSYPNTFYDPATEEWDTDGEVITPTENLEELSGKQYRIKESFVYKTSPMECEEEDESEE